jgi:hypothetical protein
VARVGERDVAHAECGELAQCTEGVTELVAPICGVWSQGGTQKGEAETDPSIPMSAEILPRLTAPMTSSAVSASSNVYEVH